MVSRPIDILIYKSLYLYITMKKEYLNKLSQLDRIEYKLREKEIDYSPSALSFVKLILFLIAFLMIFDIWGKIMYNKTFDLTLHILGTGFFQYALIFYVIAEVIAFLFWRYQHNKLNKEFFEFSFEIKPREVKRNGSKSSRKERRS